MGRHGTIAGRKEKQDSKRSQVFTKHARAIMVAAKMCLRIIKIGRHLQ